MRTESPHGFSTYAEVPDNWSMDKFLSLTSSLHPSTLVINLPYGLRTIFISLISSKKKLSLLKLSWRFLPQ